MSSRQRGEEIILRTKGGLYLGTIQVQKWGEQQMFLGFDFIDSVVIYRREVDEARQTELENTLDRTPADGG